MNLERLWLSPAVAGDRGGLQMATGFRMENTESQDKREGNSLLSLLYAPVRWATGKASRKQPAMAFVCRAEWREGRDRDTKANR